MLVDSCLDPDSKSPATERYLDNIGVNARQVRLIVASHWHDDHVRGISRLAANHPDAEFVISTVFNTKEAGAFLAAYSGASSSGLSRGAKELFDVVRARETVFFASHRHNVWEATLNARPVRVTALSPMPAAFAESLARLAQFLPHRGDAINHAPMLRPNVEAVVLHIDMGDDAVLLGADLEEHPTWGWSAVVSDRWSGARRQATAYKIAHHGSCSGDCPGIWAGLLHPNPAACLTPFTRGSQRLPTNADRARMKRNTSRAYITSGASRRPDMDNRQLKRLGDICKKIAQVDAGFGAVRLRKRIGAPSWAVELFGSAKAL